MRGEYSLALRPHDELIHNYHEQTAAQRSRIILKSPENLLNLYKPFPSTSTTIGDMKPPPKQLQSSSL